MKMEERSAIKLYFDKGFDEASIIDKLKDLKITRDKVYRTVKDSERQALPPTDQEAAGLVRSGRQSSSTKSSAAFGETASNR